MSWGISGAEAQLNDHVMYFTVAPLTLKAMHRSAPLREKYFN
jgi:hypothetical protein